MTAADLSLETHAPIPTWFGVGGGADRLARPNSIEQVARCLELDPGLVVLGDGANLLIDDDGVSRLVLRFDAPEFSGVHWDGARVLVGAGANLPKLILEAVRRGLAGIEGLAGVPASLGGAIVMNAGGAFGQIADVVTRVFGVNRAGEPFTKSRAEIAFDYRISGLNDVIVTSAELQLRPDDPARLRARLKEVMQHKSRTQPLAERSAGCVFRNPTLTQDVDAIGARGQRISAGLIIDRAGLKGTRAGSAHVSREHANFILADAGGRARDVRNLIDIVRARVLDAFGIRLDTEVVIWSREP